MKWFSNMTRRMPWYQVKALSRSFFSQILTQRVLKDQHAQIARDLATLWTIVGPREEVQKEKDQSGSSQREIRRARGRKPGQQRSQMTTNHCLPHQWCTSPMLKLSCLRIPQILGRLTSTLTRQPQTIYVTPETIFPHIGNSVPLGGSKLPTDIVMLLVLVTSLSTLT